ncbi:protein sprouty homolog 3 [Protopterus annectens]|uniref:protein sprouty homolog 3 n=1 Tax=Protopterus annectens TaxID=7888 RepID=UPI001CFA63B2|nr:protein sprouty homolog 3 [Protopterus annectens]XP_043913683.1 protein sprouty homolog 3 [Protopterus annectens]
MLRMDASPEDQQQNQQVLSIDQIRSIRAISNDYVERPTVSFSARLAQPNQSFQQLSEKYDWGQDNLFVAGVPSQEHVPFQTHHLHSSQYFISRSSTLSSVSPSSTASDHRLLTGRSPSFSGQTIVKAQPKGDLKATKFLAGIAGPDHYSGHLFICEQCGKCKCNDCTAMQSLPSCWLCNQRCLCSLESIIDYATCLCCIKGLFYHCSTDDEDNCADEPCSCTHGGHYCTRWAAMSLLSLFMPCLCCYPPAKGCLKLCHKCYDGIKRPGCRCKNHTNTVCRKISSSSGTPFPKTLDKPV